ncbi:MAG: hypothetical protein ABSB77_22200 [Xanthobacteraceae bacterium]
MRSLEAIGLLTIGFGWGWVAWKYFESKHVRLKEIGGPEWARIDRLTFWAVIGAAILGMIVTGGLLVWLDGG